LFNFAAVAHDLDHYLRINDPFFNQMVTISAAKQPNPIKL